MIDRRGEGRDVVYRLADGRDIAVAEYGDSAGRPLVMFHGVPGSRLMFLPADAPARRLGLRLICPDRPGIGKSSPHPARTLETYADDVAEVLANLNIERFALFGVSGGAPYATVAAARWRERVQLLALVSPMGPVADIVERIALPAGQRMFFLKLGQSRAVAAGIANASAVMFRLAPFAFQRMFAASLGEPDRSALLRTGIPEQVVRDVTECLRQGTRGALQDLRLFGRPWPVRWSEITAPALVWQGTADRVVPVAAALELARLLPSVRLQTMEGAGHFWIYDNVVPVLQAISDELSSLDIAP